MYIAASTNIYHTSLNISSAARFSGKTSFDSRFSIYVLFDSKRAMSGKVSLQKDNDKTIVN